MECSDHQSLNIKNFSLLKFTKNPKNLVGSSGKIDVAIKEGASSPDTRKKYQKQQNFGSKLPNNSVFSECDVPEKGQ
jgi:hypothetical protein